MDEIYTRLDDEQTERQLLAGRLNMLFRDRRAHAHTRLLIEAEARMSREAWTRAIDVSDLVHGEVISLRTTVLGQIPEIRELQAADRRRQTVISELLRLEHRRSTETSESRTALQGQITALQGQCMRTRSSSNLPVESSPNPSTFNPKRRNCRRSKQTLFLEESLVDTMADQRTMAEVLRAPTEGYAEAIVVPSILAEQFELKHSLINMMTSDQFFGTEKDNPNDHIRWFNKITSTIKYKDVPNSAIKLMHFPFSLAGAVCRTTNLRNEISNFQQRFDELFHEAWDRYKDLFRACPHHGFTELHQLDTFYNVLNPADQYSLNSAAGGNLLERRTQDVLTIIENKSKCLAADGNTFLELQDNIQVYVSAAAVNYNQERIKRVNEANMKAMETQINNVKNELRNKMKNSIQASKSNQTNELKNMMASFFQMNTASTSGSGSLPSNTIANSKGELKAITTRSGIVLDGPYVPIPPPFINLEEDELNHQKSDVSTTMTAILKQFQAILPPASVKSIEEICVTCGGAHPYYQCLAANGNTFLELRDNIQGYVSAAAVNYNQGNCIYRPLGIANQIRPSGFAHVTPPNWVATEYWVRGVLLHRSITQDIY
uniref:Reverse transcriptase domain-containing protein n=1 Tax=Tanacetum cinerariifolium TaxID=118510 RepID=A0A6L2N5R1_TANCI|nr:reverse transcriptase domain-containing protein [Tanacetum cinerariifolium]